MQSESILEVKNLSKSYDGEAGITDVSFSVAGGEIVGLVGPNGAGKTTTISIILNVLERDEGKVLILGNDPKEKREATLAQTNFSAVYAQLPGNLTIWQNLYIFGLLYGVMDIKERIDSLMSAFDLDQFRDTKTGVLSSGEQTRLNLAKVFLTNPRLLLLDEPTASLDPHIAQIVREKVRDYVLKNQAGVLWTSHNMHEVEEICDRIYFLSHGKILLQGDPRQLPSKYGKKDLEELFIAVAKEPVHQNKYEL